MFSLAGHLPYKSPVNPINVKQHFQGVIVSRPDHESFEFEVSADKFQGVKARYVDSKTREYVLSRAKKSRSANQLTRYIRSGKLTLGKQFSEADEKKLKELSKKIVEDVNPSWLEKAQLVIESAKNLITVNHYNMKLRGFLPWGYLYTTHTNNAFSKKV